MIVTTYKARWDSKKEYEKFWNNGKRYPLQQIETKPQHKPWAVLWIVVLIVAAAAFIWYYHQSKSNLTESEITVDSGSVAITIPDYNSEAVIEINEGVPFFLSEEMESITGENYSDLDNLGRCGPAVARLDRTLMPTEKRGAIGEIKPSGWVQKKYPGIVDSDPPYLYNRCHLIAYAMTGQNANELNLITGTRYMNAALMLPYEEQILRYLDRSDNHVLYRVTPVFKGAELLARGVELEAFSVEDEGEGICFNVFIYNIQPGVEIDYRTGESRLEE